MKDFTRRDFLRLAAVGLGTAALSACGQPTASTPSAAPSPTGLPATATQLPTTAPTLASTVASAASATATTVPAATSAPTATAMVRPDLVVARGPDPAELVRQALKAIGGMEQFVKSGDDVIVKPNICVAYHTYEYAATTNPWVVGAVVKLALEAGARRVRVMDFPFGGTPQEAYAISGIEEQVKAAGGEMEVMSRLKFVDTEIAGATSLKRANIYEDILNAVVINVPIAKHHSLAGLTLGMKNLMGTIRDREVIHANIGQRLTDLTSRIRPVLTIVDAVRILTNNGPTGGDLNDVKKLDTLIVSSDIVAADSYAASLFGLKPEEISYISAGAKAGLGRSDLKSLKIEEVAVGG